jgi:hypothetical protein
LWKRFEALLESPPDTQLRAGEALDIPLRILPLARRLCAGAGVSMLACIVQLLGWRQWLLALVMLAVSVYVAVVLRTMPWLHGMKPVRLLLTAEGQFRVYCHDGVDTVGMRPQSLRVGDGVLLVLRGRRTWRFWLAPGNVRPEVLAALHRRLGRGSARMPGLR